MRSIRILGVVAVVACAPLPALAQNCANFGDVLASSPFCPNVEWVKNRGVTLGCGDGSNYCPNDPVSRLQMAAFLNRLGTALTPIDVTPVATAPVAGVNPASNPVLCQTANFTAVNPPAPGFPRRATIVGTAIVSNPSANIDVRAQIVYSTDSGATWNVIANSDQYAALYSGLSPVDHGTLSPFGAVNMDRGQTMRFGVQLGLFAGSGTVTAACSIQAQIWNRNGTSSPFDDETLSSAPGKQGG